MAERAKQRLVLELIAQPTIELPIKAFCCGFSRDVMPLRPAQGRHADQFCVSVAGGPRAAMHDPSTLSR